MKIALIHGQNHKGSTYHIGRLMAQKLAEEKDIYEFFLPRDFGEFCCGCTNCIVKSESLCPHAAKLKPITDAMDNADVIILTSPVYVYHCTGSMKAFLDHYGWRWIIHRPEEKMFSKKGIVISTCAGGGSRSTNKDMKDSLIFWGVPKVYSVGKAVRAASWDGVSEKNKARIESEVSRIAARIKSSEFRPAAGLKGRFFFGISRMMNKGGSWNKTDTEYWNARGWTEKKRPWKRQV